MNNSILSSLPITSFQGLVVFLQCAIFKFAPLLTTDSGIITGVISAPFSITTSLNRTLLITVPSTTHPWLMLLPFKQAFSPIN